MPKSTYFQRKQIFNLQKDCHVNPAFKEHKVLVLMLSRLFVICLRSPQLTTYRTWASQGVIDNIQEFITWFSALSKVKMR